MPVSAQTLRKLLDAGLAGDELVDIVASIDADQAVRSPQRSAGAIRQARYRERHSDVTSDALCDVTSDVSAPLPSQEAPQTPQETQPSPKERTPLRGVPKKGCRLPDDFEPDLEWAIGQGMPPAVAATEVQKFSDYWRGRAGQGGVKLDWPATWRNWVRAALERLPQARGSPPNRANPLADAFGDLARRERERDDRTIDYPPHGNPIRLLPAAGR